VEKIKGAMMVLIKRRKISLNTFNGFAISGKSYPNSTPKSILTKIQAVSDLRYRQYRMAVAIANHRKTVKISGENGFPMAPFISVNPIPIKLKTANTMNEILRFINLSGDVR
jgi:hypothetical protein